MPETIDHLSIPFSFSSLAQFIPQSIVILAAFPVGFIAFKHVPRDKFILNVSSESKVSKSILKL